MNKIFDLIYHSLKWISKITGFTYEEVNVIIWFFILPAIFIFLLDRLLKVNYLKLGFTVITFITLLTVPSFEDFSHYVFQKSVAFLHWFEAFGINYTQASVLICVVLPLLIIGILIYLKRKKREL